MINMTMNLKIFLYFVVLVLVGLAALFSLTLCLNELIVARETWIFSTTCSTCEQEE